MGNKNKFRWVLAILAAVLFVLQLVRVDFEHFELTSLLGPISMVLLMIAMIVSIRHSNKNEK